MELFNKGLFLGMMMMILIDYKTLTQLFFYVYPANVHESKIYPILEMLKRRGLKFGDAIIMDRLLCLQNYLIGIRWCCSLIIPRGKFRFNRLEEMSYPLFIFNEEIEKRKRVQKACKEVAPLLSFKNANFKKLLLLISSSREFREPSLTFYDGENSRNKNRKYEYFKNKRMQYRVSSNI